MAVMTGLSGNEMYCLDQKGFAPGNLAIGNSVFSVGLIGGIGSGLKTLMGGEVEQITSIVHEGRQNSFQRMQDEASRHGGIGITGVTSEIIQQVGNVEFLSVGSTLHTKGATGAEQLQFSSSADGQELYCQIDAGFQPIHFVFGNVAYSIGVGGGIGGALRSLGRGEVVEYSQIFNDTRHLALMRIVHEAMGYGANAVVGIQTSIIPFQGMQEMVMIGTASRHPALGPEHNANPISSDLTNEEMWNVISMGYMPLKLVMGVSVYSVGLMGGISAMLKGFARGEISELTTLIYDARENALGKIANEAARIGADDVLGVKTNVYHLGNGIIEFMAIGTAVKRMSGLNTQSPQILPQAIIRDKDTFFNSADLAIGTNLNERNR
jgi:uncharacterized protein YbjQ (UPF0145 family)